MAELFFAVDFLAVDFFAVDFLAVDFFAAVFFFVAIASVPQRFRTLGSRHRTVDYDRSS